MTVRTKKVDAREEAERLEGMVGGPVEHANGAVIVPAGVARSMADLLEEWVYHEDGGLVRADKRCELCLSDEATGARDGLRVCDNC